MMLKRELILQITNKTDNYLNEKTKKTIQKMWFSTTTPTPPPPPPTTTTTTTTTTTNY